jgi:3-phosphoshikimate 1-carboxyvinyltransferase
MLGDVTTFRPGPLRGELTVPGDKSISHRALIAGAALAARGQRLRISNLNPGRDVRATLEALLALGIKADADRDVVAVTGGCLRESPAPIDCMNSGSTARMLLGVCAGAGVPAEFDGDSSLRRRPMEPVAAQLRAFGAKIETDAGHMPVRLQGTPAIETLNFILLSPSAQVKSALLFAGVFSGTAIKIAGDLHSRDHTERLLQYLGWDVTWDGRTVTLGARPPQAPEAEAHVEVAGDFSSAAFFVCAAALTPGSALVVRGVGINPSRTGLLDALGRMGAHVELRDERMLCGEPVADIAVEYAPLHGIDVSADLVPRAIDEIPLIAVAAAFATGTTRISGIGELRGKESDRIAAIERLLAAVGIATEAQPKGLTIAGGTPAATGTVVETHDDHRTAMAAAVLACAAGPIAIDDERSIDVSFPSFLSTLESVRT